MPIDFVCPKCRADLETPEGTAGAVTVCPACGVALIVPNLNASANAPGSAGATLAPTASAATSRATHDPASHERERTGGDLSDSSGGSSSQDAPAARSPAKSEGSASESSFSGASSAAALSATSVASSWLLEPDEIAGDVFQLARPAPRAFSTPAVLAYGAKLMQRQLVPFSWANMIVVAVLAVAVLLTLSIRFSPAFGAAVIGWGLLIGPFLAAGVASLSLRAARGRSVSVGLMWPPARRLMRIWTYFLAWAALMAVAIAPPAIGMFSAWASGRKVEAVGLGLSSLLWTMLVGARLGWFPFVFCDQPQASFFELIRASFAVSRRQTTELMRLSVLVFAAIAGTNIAIFVVGLPLAMGMAGAAYVLLAREADLNASDV